MATRMNMMKLLLEVRGFAEFTNRRLPARPLALLLQFNSPRSRSALARRKWTLSVSIQDPPDIPQPVPIKYVGEAAPAGQAPAPADAIIQAENGER
jgi:hypothetical protein